jgi:hypothetical protein
MILKYIYFIAEFVLATINRESLVEQERLELAFKMFDKVNNEAIY